MVYLAPMKIKLYIKLYYWEEGHDRMLSEKLINVYIYMYAFL